LWLKGLASGFASFNFGDYQFLAILAIFCGPLPAFFSQTPTRHIGFVANKSQTNIPPSGDRAVEGHISLFSALLCMSRCRS
jgi:hypothetical protein